MVDWEHEPTSGPAVFVGAGVLSAIGGAAVLWTQIASSSPVEPGVVVLAVALLAFGTISAGLAIRLLQRGRRSGPDRP